mgnify:CR=1 FL=1
MASRDPHDVRQPIQKEFACPQCHFQWNDPHTSSNVTGAIVGVGVIGANGDEAGCRRQDHRRRSERRANRSLVWHVACVGRHRERKRRSQRFDSRNLLRAPLLLLVKGCVPL